MKNNFIIVLFNNKEKKKIIKRFYKEKNAIKKFETLMSNNNNIIFEKKIQNTNEVNYELGLLTNNSKIQKSLFITDEMGRNNIVNLDDPDYIFLKIKKYKIEEKIFDWQKKIKITFNEFILNYCNNFDLKNIFTLNNKLCLQVEYDVFIFSLKDKSESKRFLDVIEYYFIDNKRFDGIFVKDTSITQRKWLYDVLETKGFDKKKLYRIKTTFSRR